MLFSVFLGKSFGSLRLRSSLLGRNVLETQTDESFLKSLGSSGALSGIGLGLALLVHLSPRLSPVKLHRSDSLSEERSDLVADEEVNLPILRDEALTLTRVNAILSELAKLSLDNHLSTTN